MATLSLSRKHENWKARNLSFIFRVFGLSCFRDSNSFLVPGCPGQVLYAVAFQMKIINKKTGKFH
jgi:hypothetical protein